jgi:hypothetical protein
MGAAGKQQNDEERQEKQQVERRKQLQRDKGRAVGDGDDAFHEKRLSAEKRQNG